MGDGLEAILEQLMKVNTIVFLMELIKFKGNGKKKLLSIETCQYRKYVKQSIKVQVINL